MEKSVKMFLDKDHKIFKVYHNYNVKEGNSLMMYAGSKITIEQVEESIRSRYGSIEPVVFAITVNGKVEKRISVKQ
jgi:hypothetical protein